jgi:kumamolisin
MSNAMHVAVPGSERVPVPGAKALGAANPHATLEVTLKLRRKKPLPDMAGRPAVRLTRDQLGSEYGSSAQDIEAVTQTFAKYGLAAKSDASQRTIHLSGTVDQMESAFDVKLLEYQQAHGTYRGRVGAVHVPAEVQGIVEGVFGLDNRRVARQRRNPQRQHAAVRALSAVPASWYLPKELATHYNFPAGDGSGETVAILEFGGGYFPGDLLQFCSVAKVTPPKVTTISTDGTPTNAKDGAEGEVMLDVEVVAGVCPKADIVLYFAHFSEKGWVTALDAVVHDKINKPSVVSVSWGYAEDADIWTRQAMNQVNEALKEAALIGVTVCVASGDDGSSDGIVNDGHAHADFPASSPYVLSVGGTTIPKKGAHQPDVCWFEGDGLRDDSGGSTGGGKSAVMPKPDWQKAIAIKSVNPGNFDGRCFPDLAANADWTASPYLLVVDGKAEPNGGTSAAAPLMASLLALINAERRKTGKATVGYLTPVLYWPQGGGTVGSAGCTDVTQGNNTTAKVGGYRANPGYDAVSGWGTPDGTRLMNALVAAKV